MNSFLIVALFVLALLRASSLESPVDLQGETNEFAGTTTAAVNAAKKTFSLVLEHAVSAGGAFTPRSKVTVVWGGADGKTSVLEVDKSGLHDEASTTGFRDLIKKNDMYRIRVRANSSDASSSYVSTAIPACELQKSGFKEDLSIYLSVNHDVVGLAYSSPVIALPRPCDESKILLPTVFHSRIKIADGEAAMVIPMQAQGPKPQIMGSVDLGPYMDENGKMHGEKGQKAAEQQSFLRRYWYLVVPLVLFLFMKEEPKKAK